MKVALGKISKVRGLKGEVVVIPLTDKWERFSEIEEIFVSSTEGKEDDGQFLKIEKTKRFKNRILIKFSQIDTPEAASNLVGAYLEIEKEKLPLLPDGEFYVFDIVGLKVMTLKGEHLGEIKEVWSLPANDVYIVSNGEREYNIPATREVVKEIDLKKRVMIINPLPGLLE